MPLLGSALRRSNRQLAKDQAAAGIPSPRAGSAPPFSVSPAADSLAAFAAIDQDEGPSSSGSVSVKISDFVAGRSRTKGKQLPLQRQWSGGRGNFEEEEDRAEGESGDEYGIFAADDDIEVADSTSKVDEADSTSNLDEPKSTSKVDEPDSASNLDEADSTFNVDAAESTSNAYEAGSSFDVEDVESLLLGMLLRHHSSEVIDDSIPGDEVAQNKQEQDDEILALESIYEGSFNHLSRAGDDLRCFMIALSLETIESVVEFFMPSSGGNKRDSFKLQHLPPLRLACLLPNTYPSRARPAFVLQSQWLSTERLIRLSDKLEEIWKDQRGEVVIYPWAEFLHSRGFSVITENSNELELVPPQRELEDPRVVSGSISLQEDAVNLLQYNEEMQLKTFLNSIHLCNICFEQSVGREFVKLPCQHAYCRSCMKQYTSVHVKEGSINQLRCPNTKCKGPIPPSALKELLPGEYYDKWEKLCLEKTLDLMIDVVYCPRCNMASIEDEDHYAQCGQCFFNFCSLCRQRSHVGQECLSPEARLQILLDRQGNYPEQRMREENKANELRDMAVVRKDYKQCPVCGVAFDKTGGCNKMVCSSCKSYFCFRCMKKINGYDHFRDRGSCSLFGSEDRTEAAEMWRLVQEYEQRQQRMRQMRREVREVRDEFRIGYPKTCPACRQANSKVGNNNHIYCYSCQNHYCGQCLKLVRKSSEHFGPNKCKQHTADP